MTIDEALSQAFRSHQAGDLATAESLYRKILHVQPGHVNALYLLGVALYQRGQLPSALESLRQVTELCPSEADPGFYLGLIYQAQGQLEQAVASYRQVLQLRPGDPKAHNNLGVVLRDLGRFEEAAVCCRQAVQLQPRYAEAHTNLGLVLRDLGRLEEAVDCFRQAIHLEPGFPEAHNDLGKALWNLGRFEEAMASCRQALQLRPSFPEAHNLRGAIFSDMGLLEEAIASFDHSLQERPEYAEAHRNRSMVWLRQGDYARGWSEYEWHWRCPGFSHRSFRQPRWDGSPLTGRTILLHADQGLGDTMQFVRYAPLVQQRGGRVVLECQPPLASLLSHSPGIDQSVSQGDPLPPFDVQAPLLSLPGILGTTLESIPAPIPYLHVKHLLEERWRTVLGREGFKVGIAWEVNLAYKWDRRRSVPLSSFAPLAEVPGVRLFSLQKGPGCEHLAGACFPVTDLGSRLEHFADTAAVIQCLDLVVSVDTSVVHCAGGLGKPVWVVLPFSSDWRWLMDREDSPWYPTLRLFRQQQPGQWTPVFARVTQELHKQVQARST